MPTHLPTVNYALVSQSTFIYTSVKIYEQEPPLLTAYLAIFISFVLLPPAGTDVGEPPILFRSRSGCRKGETQCVSAGGARKGIWPIKPP